MRSIQLAPALLVALTGAACVDKLSEDGRSCPCSGDRTCCFGECVGDVSECTVEKRIGLPGGTVSAPDGTSLDIPFGALSEDTVIRLRALPDLVLPDGITALGEAVLIEPEWLRLAAPATLTMAYDASRVPSGTDPGLVNIREAMTGSLAFRGVSSEKTPSEMRAEIELFHIFVPAMIEEACVGLTGSQSADDCGSTDLTIDETVYRAECDKGDPTTTCRCIRDGETVKTVEAPCPRADSWAEAVYRFECGFPCMTPADVPDAGVGPPDAAAGG
jgi:hypothetical protein